MIQIDCGRCGSDSVKPENGVYTCARCGKTYTEAEAEQRAAGLARLDRLRRMQIILLIGSMVFLVADALMLPAYAETGSRAALVLVATAACVGLFVAAFVFRYRFGRLRRALYPGK